MSDNITAPAPSGTTYTILADEIVDPTLGTGKVQLVKLVDGTIDGTNKGVIGSNGLKVDPSGVTQPVSISSLPLPTGASTAALQTTGNTSLATIATNTTNNQPGANTSQTMQSAANATGVGNTFNVAGMAQTKVTVSISGAATVTMQGTEDGTNWYNVLAEQPNAVPNSAITASGLYTVKVAALQSLRANITSFGSGNVTVTGHAAIFENSTSLPKDGSGNLLVSLATMISGEDLTNNVLAVLEKPVIGSAYATGTYDIVASATTANIKSTQGNMSSFRFTNLSTSIVYIQFHNTTTTPGSGATPVFWFECLPGNGTLPGIQERDKNWFAPSHFFSNGIAYAISSTPTTYTATGITAANHNLHVRYV